MSSCIYQPSMSKHLELIDNNDYELDDLINYSQNPIFYASLFSPDSLLLSFSQVHNYYTDFQNRFFKVWTEQRSIDSLISKKLLEYYQQEIAWMIEHPGYGENKLLREQTIADKIRNTASLENGFNSMKKGIMLNYANIRQMPTLKPNFHNFALPGEGYPFDYWQNSTIPIGTPIFIYHENENWALIDSHICQGWVPRTQIAYINEDDIDLLTSLDLMCIIKDRTPLYSSDHTYVGHADIGTVFAIHHENTEGYEAIGFWKNKMNIGEIIYLQIDKETAKTIPIPLTPRNIAMICNEMMGQIYGWGGGYYNRDCSQLLLDIFIGFGILLPRNGKQQAYNFGRFVDLRTHKEEEWKTIIINQAIPFLSLLRIPGHIMLYIGQVNNEPLVLHNFWGLRTLNNENEEGRFIVGKTVITTLEPGKNLLHLNPKMSFFRRLEGITLFE